jgi:hypothetical protein
MACIDSLLSLTEEDWLVDLLSGQDGSIADEKGRDWEDAGWGVVQIS